MPRNSSGVYSIPIAAFAPGGIIKATDHNSNYSDIATALTQSLATTGVSAMTGPIKAFTGTAASPAYSFNSAAATGFFLAGTNQIGWTANGVSMGTFNADGSLTISGTITAPSFVGALTGTFNGNVVGSVTGLHTGASIINTSLTINATAITFGAGSMIAMKGNLDASQTLTANAGALVIDVSLGTFITLALNATVTSFSVINWPASGKSVRLLLNITNNGAFNITSWPGTTYWLGGSAPTITSGAGKRDTIVLESSDGGASFRGYIAAQDMR